MDGQRTRYLTTDIWPTNSLSHDTVDFTTKSLISLSISLQAPIFPCMSLMEPSGEDPSPPIPLEWPQEGDLTLPWIRTLTSTLDWSSRNLPPSQLPSVLPVPFVQRLLLSASNILHKEPNCLKIDVLDSTVYVVGDVHGQLHDVMFLLEDAGFPSEENVFIFNGDYVDRGAWGLETFILLLSWKVYSLFFVGFHFFCSIVIFIES